MNILNIKYKEARKIQVRKKANIIISCALQPVRTEISNDVRN